jgi:hypothetical protein
VLLVQSREGIEQLVVLGLELLVDMPRDGVLACRWGRVAHFAPFFPFFFTAAFALALRWTSSAMAIACWCG